MNDIKIIRLQSGEDIVASYTTDKEGLVFISNPMVFIVRKNDEFKSSVFLTSWLPIDLIEKNVAQITKDDILTILEPSEEFKQYYFKMVFEGYHGEGTYDGSSDLTRNASKHDLFYDDYDYENDEVPSMEVEGTKTIQ
jgi:hypothetical protein